MASAPSLAFVVNNAAFFVSHRLPLALHAKAQGWTVRLYTGQAGHAQEEAKATAALRCHAIEHIRVAFSSGGMHPLVEATGLAQLTAHLRRDRPDIVHGASPKGNMYGGIAARLADVPAAVFAVSGMGYAFTQGQRSAKRRVAAALSRRLVKLAFAHPRKRVIVQNGDDARSVQDLGLATSREVVLIPGSGVELDRFDPAASENKEPLVLLPARMLRDKGVVEFVEAARALRQQGSTWRFVLAGAAGHDNPSAIPRAELEAWAREGVVEWPGQVDDIASWLQRAAIVCLPSYREGMPKALLEAAAAECAVVTTDAIGCRDAITPGQTGDLVPIGDAESLAACLRALMDDPDRRQRYGREGRARATRTFGVEAVVDRVFALYRDLLPAHP